MSIRHRHGHARPPRLRTPVRWLAATTVLGALACAGFAAVRSRSASDGLGAGLDAYARGDWTAAARVARRRLVGTPGDPAALQLLARSSVKLGLEPSALLLYQQLGFGAMDADDFYLLGHALRRTGNERGIKVWEKSLRQHADHAETLDALARYYFEGGRFHAASRLALRLADQPPWRTRANRLLGQVEFARNDFGAAIDHWRRSLDARPSPGDPEARDELAVRKDLARALLHAGRAAEARSELRSVLASGPDAEASWLLSRACLQENALPEARAALKDAGSFAGEDPARPEPAPFTGAASCAPCHAAKYQAQQGSHHAGTFHRDDEPEVLALPGADVADPANSRVTHRLRRADGRLRQETRTPDRLYQAVIDYAFGSGDRGKTLVGHDPSGEQFELRLSVYHEKSAERTWDITSGHDVHPRADRDFLGLPLTDDEVFRCVYCHATNPRATLTGEGPEAADHAIGCEKCHGPGGNHRLAVDAKLPDLAISRPSLASGSRIVKICAECHSPRGRPVHPNDPTSVRSQGTTLTWSRCYTESNDRLDCVTCHDPHRDVEKSPAHYEAKCLACHPGDGRPASPASVGRLRRFDLADTPRAPGCPVNPASGCISCHMPVVKDAIPHSPFTDHFIRIHPRSGANGAG